MSDSEDSIPVEGAPDLDLEHPQRDTRFGSDDYTVLGKPWHAILLFAVGLIGLPIAWVFLVLLGFKKNIPPSPYVRPLSIVGAVGILMWISWFVVWTCLYQSAYASGYFIADMIAIYYRTEWF
jgi:hypothetical protein